MLILDELQTMLDATEVDDKLQPTIVLHNRDIFLGKMSEEAKKVHCLIVRLKNEIEDLKGAQDTKSLKKVCTKESLSPN